MSATKLTEQILRHLDFDDLYLLRYLRSGYSVAATARMLGITQPAVTQRIRKLERLFAHALIEKVGRGLKLSPDGEILADKASDALNVMLESNVLEQPLDSSPQ